MPGALRPVALVLLSSFTFWGLPPAAEAAPPCEGCVVVRPTGDGGPSPLVVLLHGDIDHAPTTAARWTSAVTARGWALLSLECPRALGCTRGSFWRWNGAPSWISRMIDGLRASFPVDDERIYLSGWSGGASYMGWRAQELTGAFAALVFHGGGVAPHQTDCTSARTPVYFLVGDQNPLHGLARDLRAYFDRCGHPVTWDLLPRAGHQDELAALSPARANRILDWMAAHPRPRTAGSGTLPAPSLPPAPAPPLPSPTLLSPPSPITPVAPISPFSSSTPAPVKPAPRGCSPTSGAPTSEGAWLALALLFCLRVRLRARRTVALLPLALFTLPLWLGCRAPAAIEPGPSAPGTAISPAPTQTTPQARPSGFMDLRIDDRLPRPYGFLGATIFLDEERALIAPRPNSRSAWRLSRGDHRLSLRATLGLPGGSECQIKLARPFSVKGTGPADLVVELFVAPADGRIGARFHLLGSTPAADDGALACSLLAAPDAAVCRAEKQLARGQKERDMVKVVCSKDKLAEMRSVQRLRSEAKERLAQAPPALRAQEETLVKSAEQKLIELGQEADHCVGEEPIFLPWESSTAPECSALPRASPPPR